MDEFENFEAKAFVGRLLGKGDWTGFMDKIKVYLCFMHRKDAHDMTRLSNLYKCH